MLKTFFALGGNEIGNSRRSYDYTRTADCPVMWLEDPECADLVPALGHQEYEYTYISDAPWYDPDEPALSAGFLGAYVVMFEGISDDTDSATVTEKNRAGGKIGDVRAASKEVRVQLMLTALNMASLEFGKTWLSAMLRPGACGSHGSACGTTDLAFFVDCPPPRVLEPEVESDADFFARVDHYRRYLHGVGRVSGPFTVQEMLPAHGQYVGRLVEFTFVAEVPWVYGVTRTVDVPPLTPSAVQDIPYNLTPYPSAELTSGTVVVQRQYATNPSVESNATSWVATATTVTGSSPAPYFTSGRIVGELAAVGTASFRARIAGNATTAASGVATVVQYQEVLIPSLVTNGRISISIWAAVVNLGGTTGVAVQTISARAEWRDSGGAILRTDSLGSGTAVDAAGRVYGLASLAPPAGFDRVRVVVSTVVNWSSSATPAQNGDLRFYVDALAVTNP